MNATQNITASAKENFKNTIFNAWLSGQNTDRAALYLTTALEMWGPTHFCEIHDALSEGEKLGIIESCESIARKIVAGKSAGTEAKYAKAGYSPAEIARRNEQMERDTMRRFSDANYSMIEKIEYTANLCYFA